MNEPVTEADLARVATPRTDALRTRILNAVVQYAEGIAYADDMTVDVTQALHEFAAMERELAAARAAIKVAREALRASRITMSITPATDTMPGYLPELYKSQIKPTLEKVDAALTQLNTHTHE